MLGETVPVSTPSRRRHDRTSALAERGLDGIDQALPLDPSWLDAIHDQLEVVLPTFVEGGERIEPLDRAIDAHPQEPALPQGLEELALLALPILDQRSQNEPRAI